MTAFEEIETEIDRFSFNDSSERQIESGLEYIDELITSNEEANYITFEEAEYLSQKIDSLYNDYENGE